MSQQLILELSDEVYAALAQKADAFGLSPSDWAVEMLSLMDNISIEGSPSVESEIARQRFRHHAGAVSLGMATGANNEEIDVDLARAYGNQYQG